MSVKKEILDKSRQWGLGTWISIGNPVITELASEFLFDWLLFDLEHGCVQESSLIANFQAIRRKELKPIVRVGSLDPALIARVLDWGAEGIMMPHVSSAHQAMACLNAMRYPSSGKRGFSGSARVYNYGLNRPEDPNEVPVPGFMAQIEDKEGVKNAEKIAAVDGVEVLFVGPSDLKHELSTHSGKLSMAYNDALKVVCEAANKHNKQAGILLQDANEIKQLIHYGFSCFAIGSDLGLIKKGYQTTISEYRKLSNF